MSDLPPMYAELFRQARAANDQDDADEVERLLTLIERELEGLIRRLPSVHVPAHLRSG